MADSQVALTPEVDVACTACGETAAEVVASAARLAAQLATAKAFHRKRLRRRSRAALEERASFTHDYPTELLACKSCALVYRSPRPTTAAVSHVYAGERYAPERLPQMVASQTALFRPKAAEFARRLGRGKRVLEVGAFVGGFLAAAREAGLDAVGLDPSEQLSGLCARAGLRVLRKTLEEHAVSAEARSYDAIAIWSTFDQLPRPRGVLAAVAKLLRPGGLLALRFPHGTCFRRLAATEPLPLRQLAWNNLLGFPYLHGYGLPSLDRLVQPFGLTRIGVGGDVLGRVADESYARWARLEERAVKARQRARFARELALAPWLDVWLRGEG
jgi:SAM-dependent methyltransferase